LSRTLTDTARFTFPARVDEPTSMALESRKRSAEEGDGQPGPKRQRMTTSQIILRSEVSKESKQHAAALTTMEELARKGLRRSIALALEKVGFDGATADAMENFVSMTEECKIASFFCLTRQPTDSAVYRLVLHCRGRQDLCQLCASISSAPERL